METNRADRYLNHECVDTGFRYHHDGSNMIRKHCLMIKECCCCCKSSLSSLHVPSQPFFQGVGLRSRFHVSLLFFHCPIPSHWLFRCSEENEIGSPSHIQSMMWLSFQELALMKWHTLVSINRHIRGRDERLLIHYDRVRDLGRKDFDVPDEKLRDSQPGQCPEPTEVFALTSTTVSCAFNNPMSGRRNGWNRSFATIGTSRKALSMTATCLGTELATSSLGPSGADHVPRKESQEPCAVPGH